MKINVSMSCYFKFLSYFSGRAPDNLSLFLQNKVNLILLRTFHEEDDQKIFSCRFRNLPTFFAPNLSISPLLKATRAKCQS